MKTEYIIRTARPSDISDLKDIWKICFGDSESETDHFFDTFFYENIALLLSYEGKTVAAGHILDECELAHAESGIPCPYIYAIGVLPEYRGLGFGVEITKAAVRHCRALGYEICALVPAGEELFEFYREKAEFYDYFSVDEHVYTAAKGKPELNGSYSNGTYSDGISSISSEEYNSMREDFLFTRPHIRFSTKACNYMAQICSESGGGLFVLSGNIRALAAAAIEGDTLLVKELLCRPEDVEDGILTLLGHLGSKKAVARTPGCSKPFGMLNTANDGIDCGVQTAYFGFALD